jgi:hypothetical protein
MQNRWNEWSETEFKRAEDMSEEKIRAADASEVDCDHDHGTIKWNPYNHVYQCHRCGLIFVPYRYPSEEDVMAWLATHPGLLGIE